MKKTIVFALLAFTLLALVVGTADAQDRVTNPTVATFTCEDHDRDTGHELDILDSTGLVVQTLNLGDPAADANGVVRVSINVQPVRFGVYTAVVRALANNIASVNSAPSNVWDRSPQRPANVTLIRQ